MDLFSMWNYFYKKDVTMKRLIINSSEFGEQTVLYDDDDHELISKYHWYIVSPNNRGNMYARCRVPKTNTLIIKMEMVLIIKNII